MRKIEKFVFYLLIFFLPSQLAYHFWPEYAFVFGVRVDYLAPAVYFTDILVFLLISLARTTVKNKYLLAFAILAFLNIYFSLSPWVSFWKWLKILEMFFLIKYIKDHIFLIKTRKFKQVLSFSFLLISLIGITQFVTARTVGGLLYFLGERSFNITTPGIALQEIAGENYLRVYSTFSHPNSLAGFLLLGLPFISGIPRVLSVICFSLTFSLSALIAGITSLFVKKYKLMLFTLLILGSFILPFIPNNPAYPSEIRERLEQAMIAKELITKNLFLGSGINTFPLVNPDLQPVHNIYLLVFAETGIVGFGIFLTLIYKALRKANSTLLLIILIISFFDHYFLTLQQNLLAAAFVFGAILSSSKSLKLKHD